MNKRLDNILDLLNNSLGLFLAISSSVAFFVLIFKPFPLDHINYDNRILFIIGFGIIIFFTILVVRILYPGLIYNLAHNIKRPILSSYNKGFIIWLLSSGLFSIYLMYPGSVYLTTFLVFKVALICLVPPLILMFYDRKMELLLQNASLLLEKNKCQKQVNKFNKEHNNIIIDFNSINNNEKISLLITDILLINSADNYIEIHYKEGEIIKKKLLRNTLKNIRLQLKAYQNFVRCHRRYIVNSDYIEKLNGNCNHHELFLKEFLEPIPVSRQYFYKVKDAL
ncbi:LytTR family DNA-binding domain-containing protein [Lutibacter sp. TH_r2]|uniref:LytR/AlgR family response regulator transcription factor n=1 Tax=Lutibacter sp. TH_r2 TaxID=3082083 RepID=UPI002952B508|nr:LytTR family DNA-binding domain-containing protein [Lutibacter sp. TH_r2]MDV7185690.1 LytTR family DNA-binding domain-containing protein [Lutibacter sp. TH_r2]